MASELALRKEQEISSGLRERIASMARRTRESSQLSAVRATMARRFERLSDRAKSSGLIGVLERGAGIASDAVIRSAIPGDTGRMLSIGIHGILGVVGLYESAMSEKPPEWASHAANLGEGGLVREEIRFADDLVARLRAAFQKK